MPGSWRRRRYSARYDMFAVGAKSSDSPSTASPASARPSGRPPCPCSRSSRSGGRRRCRSDSAPRQAFRPSGSRAPCRGRPFRPATVVTTAVRRVVDVRAHGVVGPQLRRPGPSCLPVASVSRCRASAVDGDVGRRLDRRRPGRRRRDHGGAGSRPACRRAAARADERRGRAARVREREGDHRPVRRVHEAGAGIDVDVAVSVWFVPTGLLSVGGLIWMFASTAAAGGGGGGGGGGVDRRAARRRRSAPGSCRRRCTGRPVRRGSTCRVIVQPTRRPVRTRDSSGRSARPCRSAVRVEVERDRARRMPAHPPAFPRPCHLSVVVHDRARSTLVTIWWLELWTSVCTETSAQSFVASALSPAMPSPVVRGAARRRPTVTVVVADIVVVPVVGRRDRHRARARGACRRAAVRRRRTRPCAAERGEADRRPVRSIARNRRRAAVHVHVRRERVVRVRPGWSPSAA